MQTDIIFCIVSISNLLIFAFMNSIKFRKATTEDSPAIWEIIQHAKDQMRLRGSQQWQDGYPNLESITADIANNYGYVLADEYGIVAYGAIAYNNEPAYEALQGTWLSNQAYVILHRLAVAGRAKKQGLAGLFMQNILSLARDKGIKSFKIDTNFDNDYMLRLLDKMGFVYCGEVEYRGAMRKAFELLID